jgi:hypothetical protein
MGMSSSVGAYVEVEAEEERHGIEDAVVIVEVEIEVGVLPATTVVDA